jgi:outer membrane protein assembly factor BamE (lipoprotein component of BamABCDE complex)
VEFTGFHLNEKQNAMHRSSRFALLALAVLLLVGACAPKIANRGNILEPEKLAEIKVGESTREECATKLGSPTQVSTFDENVWYYFGRKTEQYSFLDPEVVEQKAVEVRFNDQGVVTALNVLDPSQCRPIDPVGRSTPTYGHDMTFIEQLVGNLGQRSSGAKDKKK